MLKQRPDVQKTKHFNLALSHSRKICLEHKTISIDIIYLSKSRLALNYKKYFNSIKGVGR